MNGLRQKALKGVAWSALEGTSAQALSFVVFLILARLLAPADFGLLALANIYVLIVQFCIFQGMGPALVQAREIDRRFISTAFWMNIAVSLGFILLTVLFRRALAALFHAPKLADVLLALTPLFLFASLSSVQNALLTRAMSYRVLALRTLAANVVAGGIGIGMAVAGDGYWSLVGQQLSGGLINVLLLWKASGWRPAWEFSVPDARRLWRFGLGILGSDMVGVVNRRADQYFAGKALGTAATGIYAVGARVSTLLSELFVKSVDRVVLSTFSRVQTDGARLSAGFYAVAELQMLLILPASVGLSVLAPEIVQLFFGQKWAAAVPIMQILVLAAPFEALSTMHGSVMISRDKPHWFSGVACAHAAVNLLLMSVAAPWGLVPLAAAYVVRAALLYPVELFVLRPLVRISVRSLAASLLPQAAAGLLLFASVWWLRGKLSGLPAPVVIALCALAGSVVYVGGIALFKPRLLATLWQNLQMMRARPAAELAAP